MTVRQPKKRLPILLLALFLSTQGCGHVSNYEARSNPEALSAAENEVYETVVRKFLEAERGESHTEIRALVFDQAMETNLCPVVDVQSCETGIRASFANKFGGELGRDVIEDLIAKSRIKAPLPRNFRTDIPRVFIDSEFLFRNGASRTLDKNLLDAVGIISLSPIGFDRPLQHAAVASSYHCGPLCGSGWKYILQKKCGRWTVTASWMSWIS